MSKESSKASLSERKKKQTRNSLTAKGIYDKTRSKFLKDKNGYGRVIAVAREQLLEKNGGKDPGSNVVAFHVEGGPHANGNTNDEKAIWATKGQNTAESNMRRSGKDKKTIMKKLRLKY